MMYFSLKGLKPGLGSMDCSSWWPQFDFQYPCWVVHSSRERKQHPILALVSELLLHLCDRAVLQSQKHWRSSQGQDDHRELHEWSAQQWVQPTVPEAGCERAVRVTSHFFPQKREVGLSSSSSGHAGTESSLSAGMWELTLSWQSERKG